MDKLITQILTVKRAHGSDSEALFREWLKKQLPNFEKRAGNIVCTVGKSKVLFSCHIDTMHRTSGTQELLYDDSLGHIFVKDGECLGADDGAGIFIMLKMIEAKVPGTYVFHVGEERGCIGSHAMLAQHADWLKQFKVAVAFDRPADFEVIITQGGMSCASSFAGEWLAKELSVAGLDYEISHKGVLTDTKIYAGVIPECFNLGVGYYFQHGPEEYLDWDFLQKLTKVCTELAWNKLPVARVIPSPTWVPPKPQSPFPTPKPPASWKEPIVEPDPMTGEELDDVLEELEYSDIETIEEFVLTETEKAAQVIVELLAERAALQSKLLTFRRIHHRQLV